MNLITPSIPLIHWFLADDSSRLCHEPVAYIAYNEKSLQTIHFVWRGTSLVIVVDGEDRTVQIRQSIEGRPPRAIIKAMRETVGVEDGE